MLDPSTAVGKINLDYKDLPLFDRYRRKVASLNVPIHLIRYW